jgi:hypothetical protein
VDSPAGIVDEATPATENPNVWQLLAFGK